MTNIINFPKRPVYFSVEFEKFLKAQIPEITKEEIIFYEYAIEIIWELQGLQEKPIDAYGVAMEYCIEALKFAKIINITEEEI